MNARKYSIVFAHVLCLTIITRPSVAFLRVSTGVGIYNSAVRWLQQQSVRDGEFQETALATRSRVCSDACYSVATCNEELGGRCDCPKHLAGPDCSFNASEGQMLAYGHSAVAERRNPMPCLNNCTARGECHMGMCVCDKGAFTSDCSLSLDPNGKPVLLQGMNYTPRERRPRIYVYDIPHKLSAWNSPVKLDRKVLWAFWERLLGSGALVADGDDADWYFIPVKLRSTSDGYHLLDAITYIRNHWPWYNKLHGQRHFAIHMGDTGRGEVTDQVRESTANITWLHHWGLTVPWKASGWKAAHRPGKDIVIPIYFFGGPGGHFVTYSGLHPRAPRLPRNKTLLFAGRICGDHSQPNKTAPWPHCATNKSDGYSQGVRQMVHFHHHSRPGFKIVTRDPEYPVDLYTYTWCLAPAGGGHGHRQVLTSVMGCLPVIVSDSVMQPFEPEMDWGRIGMRVSHEEIPRLHELLAEVNEQGLERRRDAMQCAVQHMMFSSMSGSFMHEDGRWDAFEFVLEVLRMQQTYPGLDPQKYAATDERFRYFLNCGETDMETYGRKRRAAMLAKYPVPLPPEGEEERGAGEGRQGDGGEVGAGAGSGGKRPPDTAKQMLKMGMLKFANTREKTLDQVLDSEPLRLCSMSHWDELTHQCRISRAIRILYEPGGAMCEGFGHNLAQCPRLWT